MFYVYSFKVLQLRAAFSFWISQVWFWKEQEAVSAIHVAYSILQPPAWWHSSHMQSGTSPGALHLFQRSLLMFRLRAQQVQIVLGSQLIFHQ